MTSRTVMESSEEFTLSGELTTPSLVEAAALHLSNMVIVEEQATTTTTTTTSPCSSKRKVQFVEEPYVIKEEDIFVPPPVLRKKRSKRNKVQEEDETATAAPEEPVILPQDIWWSQAELQQAEQNAMYLVKESQQYQEEVICTVLYNKAFLSATNLSKSLDEDELEEKLQDVTQYSNTLEQWTAVGNSRRGLESMVSEKAVLDAAQSRMLVLHFQQELKEGASANEDMAQHADFLAKRCQDTSRTARILARMMGQADYDSLVKAEELATDVPRLPEPPGRYSGDHELCQHRSQRIAPRSRRSSMVKGVKKVFGRVFRRESGMDSSLRRIQKIQARRAAEAEEEPPRRLSQEFRRSFLESLGYGPQ
jgi:hypothetical protein